MRFQLYKYLSFQLLFLYDHQEVKVFLLMIVLINGRTNLLKVEHTFIQYYY